MNKKKAKRRRDISVTFRMNADEYALLQNKVKESGLTQQAYIINAIKETPIISSDEIAVQKELSKNFAVLVQQLRGLATNVNQMAHVANGQGYLPATQTLHETADEISKYHKESETIWQLIRLSINQQSHTER